MSEYDEFCSRVGKRAADRLVSLGLLRPDGGDSQLESNRSPNREQRSVEVVRPASKKTRAPLRSNGQTREYQSDLPFAVTRIPEKPISHDPSLPRALEDDSFPFEALSEIAERESWRKEVNRPLSHIHKWWAQRLGSVFRA